MSKKKRDQNRESARRDIDRQETRPAQAVSENAAVADAAPALLARTYLPEAFLVTLLCLTPVAIPAIYYGFQVRQASEAGDQAKASAASELARIWFILSVCFGATANIAILGAYLISQKT